MDNQVDKWCLFNINLWKSNVYLKIAHYYRPKREKGKEFSFYVLSRCMSVKCGRINGLIYSEIVDSKNLV